MPMIPIVKRVFCRPGNTEISELAAREFGEMSAEGISRTAFRARHEEGFWQKSASLIRAMLEDAAFTPEILERRFPNSFGKGVPLIRRQMERLKRDQQKFHRPHTRELELLGLRSHDHKDTAGAFFLQLIRKDLLAGDKAISNSALRDRMKRFAKGDSTVMYDDLIMKHKLQTATEGDIAAYQEHIDFMDRNISDPQLNVMRRMVQAMDDARKVHIADTQKTWRANGIPEDQIPERTKEYFGDDLDAYFPVLRDFVRQLENNDPRMANKIGGGMFTKELEELDKFFGVSQLDESLAGELTPLSDFIRKNGREGKGFSFKDPESVGLSPKTYERADEALSDLFNLSRSDESMLSELVRILRESGPSKERSQSVIASISVIPDRVRVKFYKRRLLSQLPQKHPSLMRGFSSYMNTVLKAIHFDPILKDVTKISREIMKTEPHEADLFNAFVDSVTGNPNRSAAVAFEDAGRLVQTMYQATLLGNVSSTIANYVGQTGFVIAEAGVRPTMVAFRALMSPKLAGRMNPLVDMMDRLGIGLESVPKGEFAKFSTMDRLREYSKAGDWRSAVRLMRQTGIDAADIFAASEGRIRKVAYLAGMVRHLERTPLADGRPIWALGQSEDLAANRLREYLASDFNKQALANAGDDMIAKGAFLFGNANQPGLLRWLRTAPGGPAVGGSIAMFTNYPIQAMSRLAIWTNDIMRFRSNPKVAAESLGKMFRFFTYGTVVAGPFFMLPVLRGMASEGDETTAADIKRLFVAWEKNFSFAGLVGHGIKQVSGEFETIALAEKISPFPSAVAPAGPLGELFGGPAVQLARNIGQVLGPGGGDVETGPTRVQAREAIFGGFVENAISGLGSPSKPFPSGGISTLVPGGVAAARFLNSALASGVLTEAEDVQIDRFGRLIRPTSLSREIIRQFGRPLSEVLDAAEGRIAEKEAETRSFNAERIKKFIVEGNMAMVGELLVEDPSLVESIEPNDVQRAAFARTLVPQARAMLTSEKTHMRRTFRRAVNRLQAGNLTPAEEFTVKQLIAIGALRMRRERK